jgi:hypothetical protein
MDPLTPPPEHGPVGGTISHTQQRVSPPSEAWQTRVITWMQCSFARGVNPAHDRNGINTLAEAHGRDIVEVATFVGANLRAVPDQTSRQPSASQPERDLASRPVSGARANTSQETRQHRQDLADDYAKKCLKGPCNSSSAQDSQGGRYCCPWEQCTFTHSQLHEWTRHVEKRQPQTIYVCYICCETTDSKTYKAPNIVYRKDKHREHLRKVHHLVPSDAERMLPLSCFSSSTRFFSECPYPLCRRGLTSWKHQLEHFADSHSSESTSSESPETEYMSPRAHGKRSSSSPHATRRQKRGEPDSVAGR